MDRIGHRLSDRSMAVPAMLFTDDTTLLPITSADHTVLIPEREAPTVGALVGMMQLKLIAASQSRRLLDREYTSGACPTFVWDSRRCYVVVIGIGRRRRCGGRFRTRI
jgi:hypothetical protein